ncbi:MAG: fibronectin type III domain-containing protein, partial [Betaproteobacteria bacterium]|nr:fibronectin type III domain-containing protein [Betaproteobacteria bacterium]
MPLSRIQSYANSLSDDTRWTAFLPSAPTSVTTTAGNTQVTVSWTAPAVSIPSVTDYTVQYSSNSGSSWTTFSRAASSATSATVTGLTNDTAYTFRVAAVNVIGAGAYSGAVTVTPTSAPLLTKITNGTNGSFTGSGTAGSPFVAASYVGGFGSSVRFQASSACTIQVR